MRFCSYFVATVLSIVFGTAALCTARLANGLLNVAIWLDETGQANG